MKTKLILLSVLLILFTGAALAAEYGFSSIHASINIPEEYTVLQLNNLEHNEAFLKEKNLSVEQVTADFEARGVLLQAWKGDTILEVNAVQNENSKLIFDVDRQSEEVRGGWRTSFFPRNEYVDKGYEYKSSTWKNFGKNVGRFLIQKYSHNVNGIKDYSAFSRRTIKNGYEIAVEMKVFNRNVTTPDNTALNKIFKSFVFTRTEEMSATAAARVNITKIPPTESKDRKIEIAGEAEEGIEFTAAVMSLGAEEPQIVRAQASNKNKFSIPVTFSKQGVYLITLNATSKGEEIGEWAFPVTYREGLLSVDINEVPDVVTTDETKIRGTAEAGATIQVLMNDKTIGNKRVNREGKFVITLNTKEEGSYEVVLVFNKKDLKTRRFKLAFTRKVSQEQSVDRMVSVALSATYPNLMKVGDKFLNKNIKFTAHVESIEEKENGTVVKLAYTKKNNRLSNYAFLISESSLSQDLVGRKISGVAEFLGLSDVVTLNLDLQSDTGIPILKLVTLNE